MELIRNCPTCNKILIYTSKRYVDKANTKNSSCMSCSRKGEGNPMYGKKHAEGTRKKQSISHIGKKNSMYGKPSPYGTGSGWQGWYKGWFFRSLLELSYMVNVIEAKDLEWESAETKKFMIPYVNNEGIERNYFPDFFLEGIRLVEIKPKWQHLSIEVQLKKEAAEEYCLERGWQYELIYPDNLTKEEIIFLYVEEKIKFTSPCAEKFKEKYIGTVS